MRIRCESRGRGYVTVGGLGEQRRDGMLRDLFGLAVSYSGLHE